MMTTEAMHTMERDDADLVSESLAEAGTPSGRLWNGINLDLFPGL